MTEKKWLYPVVIHIILSFINHSAQSFVIPKTSSFTFSKLKYSYPSAFQKSPSSQNYPTIYRCRLASESKTREPSLNKVASSRENIFIESEEDQYFNVSSIHLVSLSPLASTSPQSLRNVWKWKDLALGNGHDYFFPRPRAISDLQSIFLKNHAIQNPDMKNFFNHGQLLVEECAILSNCARLDIYLVLRGTTKANIQTGNYHKKINEFMKNEATYLTAQIFGSQLESYQRSKVDRSILSESMLNFLDLPGVINLEAQPQNQEKFNQNNSTLQLNVLNELVNSLTTINGIENVTRHACLVAAGIQERPSRPGLKISFRPFSSRDAHIMLQMKRLVEGSKGNKLQIILQAGLQAGKAARDPGKVEEIKPLKGYNNGEGGRYSKPDAPLNLVEEATEAAINKAIEPAINKCISKFHAMDSAAAIKNLRQKAQNIINDSKLSDGANTRLSEITIEKKKKRINRILHAPTMALRKGKSIDEESILIQVKNELLRI